MKLKVTRTHIQNIIKVGVFLCVIAIIVQLYPMRKNRFQYHFEVGKPWRYELMTAAYDFPIYKSEKQLERERIEALKDYVPYFTFDHQLGNAQLQKMIARAQSENLSNRAVNYLKTQFEEIYSQGILAIDAADFVHKEKYSKIAIINENRLVRTVNVATLYTPKTAYKTIIDNAPALLENNIKKIDINTFLVPNLQYDTLTSEVTKSDIINNISITSGLVQTGERIIDRGEIVTEEIYRILNSLKINTEQQNATTQKTVSIVIGEVLFISLFILLLGLYLYLFRPRIFGNLSHLLFILLLILIMVVLSSVTLRYTKLSIYIVPFAWLPIIVRIFFDSRTALFAHLVSTTIISFMVPVPFEFIILQVAIGMTAVSSLKDMMQRAQLAQTALWVFITYCVAYVAYMLIAEGDISKISWQPFVYFAVSSLFVIFAYGLIYVFEKLFGLISSITLIELTNVNSDLMIKFAEVAPGTFQHSLQVSNLATEAAKKINANSLLVRTGALYHDIGKMEHPQLFVENQQDEHNLLLEMDLEEAAQAVINHVTDGVKLAEKKHLPEIIINFIRTHHGTSRVKYFYNTFVNKYPDRTPNEAAFTYAGPRPNSKETAILMMADAIEACSRSLQVYTEESINNMVERMIDGQMADGQFKDTPLSFRDVEEIKEVFKAKIKSMYHHRIVYPDIKKKENE